MSGSAANVLEPAKIGFGGGCHWCTEGVFQSLRGVIQVDQGYIRSDPPADTWAEAVIVTYEPSVIALDVLCDIHLRTHEAGRHYDIRSKYRSAIYTSNEEQDRAARDATAAANANGVKAVRTRVMRLLAFKPSEEQFKNYYRKNPERRFSRRFIDTKLDVLRTHYSSWINSTA